MKEKKVVRKGKPNENHRTDSGIGHTTAICLCFKEGVNADRRWRYCQGPSGVDLLAFFYKLIVSVYTVKEFFLKNMILLLACKFLEGTGRVL